MMFDTTDLDRLLAAMRTHGVTLLEIDGEDGFLRLGMAAIAPPAAPEGAAPGPARVAALSPDIGAFLPRGDDDGLAPLAAGAAVRAGEVLAYVTRGAIRAAVTAPTDGVLASALPAAGTILGFGDAVIELERDA